MKCRIIFFLISIFNNSISAQIKVEFSLDKSTYDYYEDVLVGVKLTNVGNENEGIGKYNSVYFFKFQLEDENGNIYNQNPDQIHSVILKENERQLEPHKSIYIVHSLSYLYGIYDEIFQTLIFNKSGKLKLKSTLYPDLCNISFETGYPTEKSKLNIQLVYKLLQDKNFKEMEFKKGNVLKLPQIKRMLPNFIRINLRSDDSRMLDDDNCAYNIKYLIRKYGNESFFISKCIDSMWYFSKDNPKRKKLIKKIVESERKWKSSKNKEAVKESISRLQQIP